MAVGAKRSRDVINRLLEPRVVYALVAALYVLVFPWHPGLRSPNELCRLWQARALVEDHSLSINGVMQRYGSVGDLSVKDGIYYPSKAPLMSFLAAPIYQGLRALAADGRVPEVPQVFFSRLLLTILPTLVMLYFLRRFLGAYVAPRLADALTVTYALGSLAFSYSEAFFSHQATAVLMFFSFYWAWRTLRAERPRWGWAVAGAFAGAAVMAEYTAALTVLCVAVYAAVGVLSPEGPLEARARKLAGAAGLVLLGASPFLGGLMAYHQACFGGPLTSGYKYLADTAYQGWHLGGFLGIRYPDPRAFALSFFSPLRGLFMLSPFLLLAFVGLKDLRAHRALFWFTVVLLLGNAYFTSSFTYDSWGWTTGPRHMTPLVPFLLLPVALGLQRLKGASSLDGRVGYGLAVGLAAASMLSMGCITFVNYVPDSLSTSLFGLVVPLFGEGLLPPTVLDFLGVPSPAAGVPAFVLLFACTAAMVAWLWRESPRGRAVALAAALAGLGHLALLAGATRHDGPDLGAVSHLRSVWLARPGASVTFWQ